MRKKKISKFSAMVSILLCFALVLGSVPAYAVNNTQPDAIGDTATVWFLFVNFRTQPNLSSTIKSTFLFTKELKVLGYEGDFAYVQDPDTKEKGYVFRLFLIDNGEVELKVTTYNNVYKGDTEEDSITITYNGSKDFTWSLSDSGIVEVTQGSKSNKLTVKAGSLSEECKLHCYYKWKQSWTTAANTATTIYKGPGSEYGEKASLAKNAKFIVSGDDGGSAGWAYGYTTTSGTNYWGYVNIKNISTKGTVSQYNSLGWAWPVKNSKNGVAQTKKANYISSPYGWRDTSPKRHQGVDITTGTSGEIAGYDVVSAFDGTVVYRGSTYGYDWGYCVAIRSDEKDPVSGMCYVAVYMHLMEPPAVAEGKKVVAGETVLGHVGNTTDPDYSMGYHLHFEFNNQNSSIGVSNGTQFSGYGRKSYDYLVNPIFLYMDEYENGEIDYNKSSEAEKKYKKTFWYGNGDEYSEAS